MAENLKKKNNNKIILCFILFISLFTANLCWAGTSEDTLSDDFFKAAEEIELLDNNSNDKQNNQNENNQNNENDITKNNTINKVIESSKIYIDLSIEKIKAYSIKINNLAEKAVSGNKMLAKLLIISILSIISLIAIFLLLIIFKIIFGRKRKKQNPFNTKGKNVFETEVSDIITAPSEENINTYNQDNSENYNNNTQIDETINLKYKVINEPPPTDIKSAVRLFIKITA